MINRTRLDPGGDSGAHSSPVPKRFAHAGGSIPLSDRSASSFTQIRRSYHGRATCRETCTCGSGRGFLRYLITMLLLAAGAPLLTIAHLFRNNPFRRDNSTYFCQILPLLSTAGTISMCFDSSEQERFDASESIVSIPLPTRSMLFMIPAHDAIAMYLAIEPQSLCFYVIAASKRKSEFSTEAGSKYLILGAFPSGILLFGYDRTTTDIFVNYLIGITCETSRPHWL